MFKKIVVPLDGSSLSEKALLPATELAKTVGASLHLVAVLFPIDVTWDVDLIGMAATTRAASDREYTSAYLSKKAKALQEKGVQVSWEVREGPIAPQILEAACEAGAGLIVMSTRGRSGIGVFLGSVAEKVAHLTKKMPVMLIPIKEE